MQIRIADWPTGLNQEIALIEQAIEGLGLTFERNLDDLDYFAAAILSDGMKTFALQRHENSPAPGFVLIAAEPVANDEKEVRAFLTLAGLPVDAVIWTRP